MKKTNKLLIIIISLIGVIAGVFYLTISNIPKSLVSFSIIPIMIIPSLIFKKINISSFVIFIYLIFIFFSQLLGSVFGLYNILIHYDKIIHFISGILTSLLALKILNFYKYDNSKLFNLIFIFSFSFLIAGIWEIFEYIMDNLLNGDAQRVVLTGVHDTMQDIISSCLGSISFIFIRNRSGLNEGKGNTKKIKKNVRRY